MIQEVSYGAAGDYRESRTRNSDRHRGDLYCHRGAGRSRTLARSNREGLSPATIRNVMADLADAGFLEQPHTSSGRVPSTEAYRYYVEQITGKAHLSPETRASFRIRWRALPTCRSSWSGPRMCSP